MAFRSVVYFVNASDDFLFIDISISLIGTLIRHSDIQSQFSSYYWLLLNLERFIIGHI